MAEGIIDEQKRFPLYKVGKPESNLEPPATLPSLLQVAHGHVHLVHVATFMTERKKEKKRERESERKKERRGLI